MSKQLLLPEGFLSLLQQINEGEIENVDELLNNCSRETRRLIPACIDYGLVFISSDDRLLLTEYGITFFLKLNEINIYENSTLRSS